jgi:iron complex transport system ATP-binding protein
MTTLTQPSSIQTKRLSIGYPRKGAGNPLFENLNLILKEGEFTCFMGANGIGKSTLIRTLAGLQKPISGDILIDNKDLSDVHISRAQSLARQIAVVLTDRVSSLNMNVHELVSYGRYPYLGWGTLMGDEDKKIVQRSIDFVQINHLAHCKIHELSDGQLQMVMIARALAQDTPIILLDEPTAHLDLNNRLEIMNLLRRLARTRSKTILVATHELDLALQTADIIWLAGQDRSIVTGIPEDLVLNGRFDEIFKFKGFDLKTGKVYHEAFRQTSVRIEGNGHNYLWTKNALERCGFSITEDPSSNKISIISEGNSSSWIVNDSHHFGSIHELIDHFTSHAGG